MSTERDLEGWVATDDKIQVKEPPLYKVLLHNDDYTSMEFVVLLLEKVFHKSTSEATRIMLNVHQQGIGVAGVYLKEIAETKVAIVHDLAQKNEYPLRCTIEKV
ncbi:ATP-dependent Clp protease adapter ClpS [Thermodesulfobacteriota bacterium]